MSEMQAKLTEREVIDHLFRMATTRLRWHLRNFALPVWKEWRNLTECFALSDHVYTQYGCLKGMGRDEIARRTSYKDRLGLTLEYDIDALRLRRCFSRTCRQPGLACRCRRSFPERPAAWCCIGERARRA